MALGGPGKARANTIYHGASTRKLVFCFPWLSASGPQVLLVVEPPASRVEGEAAWENGDREAEEVKRQEVETRLSGRADI